MQAPVFRKGWPELGAAITGRGIALTVLLSLMAAALLNPIFDIPFTVLVGRLLFLGLVLLLAYAAGRTWPQAGPLRWVPAWLAPIAALVAAAPPTTLVIYLFSTGGSVRSLLEPERLAGFVWIAGSGVVFGLLSALTATLRERMALERARALEFELERQRLEKQAVDAQLALLQAQVEPHFLFNTLANVQALVEENSPRAAPVLRSLVAYLRAAVPQFNEGAPTLARELGLVRAYLELMQMRMPDRMCFHITAEAGTESLRFPPMALLTLVENAVRHGIDPCEDGGRIDVNVRRSAEGVHVSVTDTGVGLDPRAAPGTGLANLRARLVACFGGTATLVLDEVAPHGLKAEITLPA